MSVYLAGGDFSTDTVGALASVRGFTFARASTATTYDETAGTVATGVGVDTARAAKSAAGRVGLLVEPVRTNLIPYDSVLSGGGWAAGTGATETADAVASPDGTTTADRSAGASGAIARYWTKTATHSAGTVYAISFWMKNNGGGNPSSVSATFGVTASPMSPTSAWTRFRRTAADTSGASGNNYILIDGRNNSGSGGNVATAYDLYRWGHQIEVSGSGSAKWSSSLIPTTGTSATRAADKLSIAESTVEAAGALRFYCKVEMPSTLLNHVEAGGSGELTLWTDAAGSYKCWIDASSGAIYAQALASDLGIPAAVYTTSSPVSVAAGDLLEVWVVCGGAALPTIKYRINAGSVVTPTLSSGTRTHTLPTIGATVHVLGDSTGANGLYGTVQTVAFYADGQAPGGF